MATVTHQRHAGGRPVHITKLTDFGRALQPVLDDLGWSVNDLAERTRLEPTTIWRWMKTAKKWPPSDRAATIAGAVGRPLSPSPTRSKRR